MKTVNFAKRAFFVFSFFGIIGLSITYGLFEAEKQETLAKATDSLAQYRGALERELAQDLALTASMKSYIAVHPQLDQIEFSHFAQQLLIQKNHIRNIGAAKDMVISHIYPLEGNEKALGFSYKTSAKQYEAVQKAVDEDTIVLAGPLTLVQGGSGLIARQPVVLTDDGTIWGVVSVVINSDDLFASVTDAAKGLDIAIRGKDAAGEAGEIILGEQAVFDDPVSVNARVALPYGSWYIAARLVNPPSYTVFHFALILTIAVLCALTILVIQRQLVYDKRLVKEKQIAEQANTAKSRFLAHMSHEIRTPMNGVIGVIQLLQDETLTADQKYLVETAKYSAENLLNVINDILDFSKIEAQQLKLETAPFKLRDVVEYVRRNITPLAQAKNVGFEVVGVAEIYQYWVGDQTRLGQILLNLASNAVKFTEHGHVSLKFTSIVRDDAYFLECDVTDTGIGMNDVELSRIFKSFSQADTSVNRRFGGTGLGLFITKTLVEMMGGTISVRSKAGEGSVFTVSVPLEKANDTNEEVAITFNGSSLPSMKGVVILLAEDVDLNAILFQRMMAKTEATILRAVNGKEALDIFEDAKPDIIFMDIQMPAMDGMTATQLIRHQDPHIPIIALTANVISDDVQSYYENGFTKILSKPMKMSELFVILADFMASRNR
ncbi:hybrid sensor histidine kinase/response regulator [Kordiimonas pumila]|uniref:histidine kinase n=1 Tax=Kordiimonas pumila TaxID=2161677 RepID=A0ABV7D8W3_9PROT|nr:ATP-binding protein [Kordiimonas pumila]